MAISNKSRNIPSLDGLRAISILMVIVAHSNNDFSRWIRMPARSYIFLAHTGVAVFFVISGFLITNLLLKESEATGGISLKRFYLRRAFRIFPPFYTYLGIIFLLAAVGVFHTPLTAFFFAGSYTLNYYFGPGGGFVGIQHIWSLCMEEQFYLLWPAALLFVGRRRATYLAVVLIVLSPFSRLATYLLLAPAHRAMVQRMLHSGIDTIMFGCLSAILWKSERFHRTVLPWLNSWIGSCAMAGCVFFLLVLDPALDYRFYGGYDLMIGMTLEGFTISLVMLYVVIRPETLPGLLLNTPIMRHIGIISYSLYLWQNVIIGTADRYFPWDLLAIFVCAELSYWVVERPALRLRDQLQKRSDLRRMVEPQPLSTR